LVVAPAPAADVTVTGRLGATDPGLARGESLLVSFDQATAAGVTDICRGTVITAAGSIGVVRAAAAGIGNSIYRSIGGGSESLFDFLDLAGLRVIMTGSSSLPLANGNQTAGITNRRIFFEFKPEQKITAARLRSNGAAVEFDNIGVMAVVPEPETGR